jgi:hypothetical protein
MFDVGRGDLNARCGLLLGTTPAPFLDQVLLTAQPIDL